MLPTTIDFFLSLTVSPLARRASSASSVRYVTDEGPSQPGSEGGGGATTASGAGAPTNAAAASDRAVAAAPSLAAAAVSDVGVLE